MRTDLVRTNEPSPHEIEAEPSVRNMLAQAGVLLTQAGLLLKCVMWNTDASVDTKPYAERAREKLQGAFSLLDSLPEDQRTVAHDLKNMLTALMNSLGLASDDSCSTENKRSWLEKSHYFYSCAAATLEEELDPAKKAFQSGAQVQRRVGLLVRSFGGKLTASCGTEFFLKKTKLSGTELDRLIFNLLDNARNAGASDFNVTLSSSDAGIEIRIKDNGPGFQGVDPFEASRLSRERDSAHGNGNIICKELCEKAGGSLALSDIHDSTGAEWVISLPFLRQDFSADRR